MKENEESNSDDSQPVTTENSKRETIAPAKRDDKEKLAKTKRGLSNNLERKLVGAINQTNRGSSCKRGGKYGLSIRSGANIQASQQPAQFTPTKAGLRNNQPTTASKPEVRVNVCRVLQGDVGTDQPDISFTEETDELDNDGQRNPPRQQDYLVQATLVSPTNFSLEAGNIPQAEIVDLENLMRPPTSAEPSSSRSKACLGAIGFLILLLFIAAIVAVEVLTTSSNDGRPEPTPPLRTQQPTPYLTTLTPTTNPTSPPQPTAPPAPITAVEWFGEAYPIENTTEIDLWDHHLQGTLPTELGLLTALTLLRLDGNHLNGTIPTELAHLENGNLAFLRLDGNDLVGSLPSELGLLTTLTRLTFGMNQLTGTIPTQLGELTSLEGIWAAGNTLEGSIPSELGLLTVATSLVLQRNRLTGAVPTELGSMNLTTLWLYNNQLEGSLPTQVCQIPALSDLSTDCAGDPFPLNCSCGTLCKCF